MHETIGYDLVIEEEELQTQMEQMLERVSRYEATLAQYDELLKAVKEDAVMEGNTAENLSVFSEALEQLKGELAEITEQIYRLWTNYQMEIDVADSYLN